MPSRPSGLTAVSTDSSKITIAWNAVQNASSYTVERSESPEGTWTTVYQGSPTNFDDTDLQPSTFYYYRVCATNSEKTSQTSYIVSAQLYEASTDPMTPTGLTATTLVDVFRRTSKRNTTGAVRAERLFTTALFQDAIAGFLFGDGEHESFRLAERRVVFALSLEDAKQNILYKILEIGMGRSAMFPDTSPGRKDEWNGDV